MSCSTIHSIFLGVCRCDCVFVDVGLNDGRTLQEWPVAANHMLQRLHLQPSLVDSFGRCMRAANLTTCYYGFEANEAFDKTLQAQRGLFGVLCKFGWTDSCDSKAHRQRKWLPATAPPTLAACERRRARCRPLLHAGQIYMFSQLYPNHWYVKLSMSETSWTAWGSG